MCYNKSNKNKINNKRCFMDYPNIMPDFSKAIRSIENVTRDIPANYMWSDTQFEIIKNYIQEYESSLDRDHEVGLYLTNFGQSVIMRVTEITYEKSVLLIFKGYVNGRISTLIQHINQLNFLLTTIEKAPDTPARRIGFSN
jgi:hypothetical protein